MNMFRMCSAPNVMWNYNGQDAMDDFYSKVLFEAEEKYGKNIPVTGVPGSPYIFRVFNQNLPEGSYPMIYYMSKIRLKDTTALKVEYNAVRKVIGDILPGINENKKYLFYTVFSEKSSPKKKFQDHVEYRDEF